jgi:transposase
MNMYFLGVDWATEKHDVCLMAEDGVVLSEFIISNDMAGFEKLHQVLLTADRVKVNIERTDGLLVEWLMAAGYAVYMTPPNILAHRRPRRSKDDRGDAYLLASLLRTGDGDVRLIAQQSTTVQHLRQLVSTYDMVLHQQRQLANRLIHALRQYYPVTLQVFRVPTSLVCLTFLDAYPTPARARALNMTEFEAFLRKQHYTHLAQQLPRMYALLQAPAPVARVVDGLVTQVRILVPILVTLHKERSRLTKAMVALFNTHPDAALWRSIPGATGPLTSARLLAWIGDDRSRFSSSQILQATAGTAPITRRSGKSHTVEFRRACSHPLRKTLDDLARQSIKHSGWANGYFHNQLARGHDRPRAFRALANRWARVIWKLWQHHLMYDEAVHLAHRAHKGQPSPLKVAA